MPRGSKYPTTKVSGLVSHARHSVLVKTLNLATWTLSGRQVEAHGDSGVRCQWLNLREPLGGTVASLFRISSTINVKGSRAYSIMDGPYTL